MTTYKYSKNGDIEWFSEDGETKSWGGYLKDSIGWKLHKDEALEYEKTFDDVKIEVLTLLEMNGWTSELRELAGQLYSAGGMNDEQSGRWEHNVSVIGQMFRDGVEYPKSFDINNYESINPIYLILGGNANSNNNNSELSGSFDPSGSL